MQKKRAKTLKPKQLLFNFPFKIHLVKPLSSVSSKTNMLISPSAPQEAKCSYLALNME